DHLATLLLDAVAEAEGRGLRLAPFVGLGCPGLVRADGTLAGGVQNLPGDWTEDGFCLPERVRLSLHEIGGRPTVIRLHNDAVIQGLSEWPFMRDVTRWAAVTIGTGLGNCAFRNREATRFD
ncbi:MAG: ROK family protein, partial [Xanthomonas perforans]|nr:ROK family protein [Xanthomonas perforans]